MPFRRKKSRRRVKGALLGAHAKKPRKPDPPFNVAAALARADLVLSLPPEHARIERRAGVGALVVRFVLPLRLCPGTNAYAELERWQRDKLKEAALVTMRAQQYRRPAPLPGRPMVRCVRFSVRAPDRESGWCKVPVDRLTTKHGGLGFISDDRDEAIDLRVWWEPVAPGRGLVLVEVWTGAA